VVLSEYTVCIHIESDFNLRDTTRGGRNSRHLKLAEQVVVLSASTLSFVYLNEHTGLIIRVGREDLGFLGWNGSVTLDESGHDTSSGLDTKGKRGNVEEKKVLSLLKGITGEDSSLHCSTIGNSLIRVDALVGLLAVEEVGHKV
jgi:hypothetical protein